MTRAASPPWRDSFARDLPRARAIGRFLNGFAGVGIALLCIIGLPRAAEACGCTSGTAPSHAYRTADAVFVATAVEVPRLVSLPIVHPDGTVGVKIVIRPTGARLAVTSWFKGGESNRLEIPAGPLTSCYFSFAQGRSYLVYARIDRFGLDVSKCATRFVEDAVEDLKYLNNLREARPQGVVFGLVHRRVQDQLGQAGNRMPFEAFDLVAMRDGVRYEVRTHSSGRYVMVLDPSSYHLWIERDGKILTNPELVSLAPSDEKWQHFVVEE